MKFTLRLRDDQVEVVRECLDIVLREKGKEGLLQIILLNEIFKTPVKADTIEQDGRKITVHDYEIHANFILILEDILDIALRATGMEMAYTIFELLEQIKRGAKIVAEQEKAIAEAKKAKQQSKQVEDELQNYNLEYKIE